MKRYSIVIFILLMLSPLPICAAEAELYTPEQVRELLGTDAYTFISGNGDILTAVTRCMGKALSEIYPIFFSLCGMLALAALIKSIGGVWQDDDGVYGMAGRLSCCLIIFASVKGSCLAVKGALDTMAVFMSSMIGVMCVGWGMSGNIVGGGRFGASVALAVQCVSFISSYCVMPMTYSCFGLTLGSSLSAKAGLESLISGFKKLGVTVLGGATALFSFSLAIRTVGMSGAENAVNNSIKFAAASFIPIVGSALAEATGAVVESMRMIRTFSSVAAMAVILLTALPPIAVLCADKLALSCASGVAGMLSLDAEKKLIDGINSLLTVLIAVTVCSAVVFTVCCALFMKTNYA